MDEGIIVGLTGRFGAGCTSTGTFFEKNFNFKTYSVSSFLKTKAKKEISGFELKTSKEIREILQDLGDSMRKIGPSALVQPIIQEIKKNNVKNAVIECLRNPAEIKALKEAFGGRFFLISVDAETEIRWKRVEELYKGDRAKFDTDEKRDAGGEDQPEFGQQVKECMEQADILINSEEDFFNSDGTKNEKAIDRYGQKLSDYTVLMQSFGVRPPYPDELYMHQACSIALWSKCSRRQVGAVIVREILNDKSAKDDSKEIKKQNGIILQSYVISMGCNNVPWGEKDCAILYKADTQEAKCYREKIRNNFFKKFKYCRICGLPLENTLTCKCGYNNKNIPGKMLDLCRAVHAEEAAIIQSAKLGSSPLEGTKLYTSLFPCMLCAKKIINSGIKSVVYLESYPMGETLAIDMFRKCNIFIKKYEGVTSNSFNKLFRREIKKKYIK